MATGATKADDTGPVLEVRDLVQEFALRGSGGVKGGIVRAVSGVSFTIGPGEALGLVGETGSGKSTIARSVLQAPPPKSGEVCLNGAELHRLGRRDLRQALRHAQMVFQDPYSSMNPRWRVWDIVEEPLVGFNVGSPVARRKRAAEVLDRVGIPASFGTRRPREMSGGQCQRVAIARALVLSPSLILCDEAVSALDVLIQAQILSLFRELRDELGLSYLFIAHDLAAVRQVSDRVAVMYLGKLCEVGPVARVFASARHPYTSALLASVVDPRSRRRFGSISERLTGEDAPSPIDPPSGCRFRTRCPRAREICTIEEPRLESVEGGHLVACHFPQDYAPAATV